MRTFQIIRSNGKRTHLFQKTYPSNSRLKIEQDFKQQLEMMTIGQSLSYGEVNENTFTPTMKILYTKEGKMIEATVNGKVKHVPYHGKS
jgi:hypothetical protein